MAYNEGGVVPTLTEALKNKGYPTEKIHAALHTERPDYNYKTFAQVVADDLSLRDTVVTLIMHEHERPRPDLPGLDFA